MKKILTALIVVLSFITYATAKSAELNGETKSNQQVQSTINKKTNLPSWAPDPACNEEYLNNIDDECVEAVKNKIKQKLSPHCKKLSASGQLKELFKDCEDELALSNKQIFLESRKCNKLPVDSKCRKQVETAQIRILEDFEKCGKAMRKVLSICTTAKSVDHDCLVKHRAETAEFCGK